MQKPGDDLPWSTDEEAQAHRGQGTYPRVTWQEEAEEGLLGDTDLIFLQVAVSFLLLGVDRGTAICSRVSLISGRLGRFGN